MYTIYNKVSTPSWYYVTRWTSGVSTHWPGSSWLKRFIGEADLSHQRRNLCNTTKHPDLKDYGWSEQTRGGLSRWVRGAKSFLLLNLSHSMWLWWLIEDSRSDVFPRSPNDDAGAIGSKSKLTNTISRSETDRNEYEHIRDEWTNETM